MVQTGSGRDKTASADRANTTNIREYFMIISDNFDLRDILIQKMEQIQALRFQVDEVGKHVKGSKKRYTWDISLKDKHHTIILDFSFISGKVKITVDRKILLENELPSNVSFQYPFTLQGFALNIIQQGESFELRINNKVFSHLYTQHKTNTEFKKYEDQVKDIKVNLNQLNPQKQKIQLNIGAFGGMNKKKKDVVGGAEGWNAFSGGSFPNYFGDQAKPTEQKSVQAPQQTNFFETETTQPTPFKTEALKAEVDLLGEAEPEKKPPQSIIDIDAPSTIPSQVPPQDDFNTMQNMFSTLNTSQPPPQQQPSMDFFADQPKKQVPPTAPVSNPSNFDLNLLGSNPPPSKFATGSGPESNNIDAKAFSNSALGGKPLEMDFFNQPPKENINVTGFSKKPVEQTSSAQMENLFSGTTSEKPAEIHVNSPLTDMSLNDFMESKPKQAELNFNQSSFQVPPSANNFNTMQNLFQTGNPSAIQSMQANQPSQMSGISMGSSIGAPGQSPNESNFSTLQQMFQTSNYANLNKQDSPNKVQEQKFSMAEPSFNKGGNVFATMGGGPSASSNFQFDMNNFGTMQANQKSPQGNLDFFESKPATTQVNKDSSLL